jgi:hypothetical protein
MIGGAIGNLVTVWMTSWWDSYGIVCRSIMVGLGVLGGYWAWLIFKKPAKLVIAFILGIFGGFIPSLVLTILLAMLWAITA